jgi:pSer/pThr/pTyr-binding forkhead associated (FHA) protein
MANRMPVLVNVNTGEQYVISGPSTTVGRHPDSDLFIGHDDYCSANHARIYWEQGSWMVEDLKSSNGTFVNDLPIVAPYKLSPKDIIKFGRTLFRIE